MNNIIAVPTAGPVLAQMKAELARLQRETDYQAGATAAARTNRNSR